jgi:uncharacterized protein with HEPN domain
MWRDDACLLDMLIAARKIRAFTEGVTLDRFLRDELMQHAIMRLIEILGEAARHISEDFRANHPEVPCHITGRCFFHIFTRPSPHYAPRRASG